MYMCTVCKMSKNIIILESIYTGVCWPGESSTHDIEDLMPLLGSLGSSVLQMTTNLSAIHMLL